MRVALLNPNTTEATTAAMCAIARAAAPTGLQIEAISAPFGVPLIMDPAALAEAADAVASLAAQLADFDGVIVAAFGDPGRARLQKRLHIPVVGIGEASMAHAARIADRFSVVTTTPALRDSIIALAESYGHGTSLVSVRTTGLDGCGGPQTTLDLMADPAATEEALHELVCAAISSDGAGAVIIGGGPLANAARALAARVDCPLVQPIPAAVALISQRLGLLQGRLPARHLWERLCRTSVPAEWHHAAGRHTLRTRTS